MDIQTVVVGSGPVSSLVVLRPHELGEGEHPTRLPIRIGTVGPRPSAWASTHGRADAP